MERVQGFIDLHSHILPGLDDGAKNLQETEILLDMAYEQGIRYIIATPHYMKGNMSYTKEEMFECFREVKELSKKKYPDLAVFLGQEIFYSASIVEELQAGEIQTLNGSEYVLIEFSVQVSYRELYEAMRTLVLARYIPILAHMERYECLWKRQDRMIELKKLGIYFQMNVGSILGSFLDARTRECRKLVLEGQIEFLGTDMHDSKYRTPKMAEAIKWLKKRIPKEAREELLYQNPMRVLRQA